MTQVAAHSSLVGGSTASRVINCPGSVALVAKMPPRPSSEYADKGTLLHDTISDILPFHSVTPEDYLGRKHRCVTLTQEMIDALYYYIEKRLNEIEAKVDECLKK